MNTEATDISITRDDADELRHKILELVGKFANRAHARAPFVPGKSVIPVSGMVYGESEMMTLVDSALDFWLTTGRFNEAFERGLSDFMGVKNVLTVNSGSSANLVAVTALASPFLEDRALKPGDEVITCATGFPTTVNPLFQNGLVPVFLDVDIPTYNIDVSQLENAMSDRTRALAIAHTLGNPFNLDAVMKLAKKHDLWVLEDCCDALGAKYDGRNVGTFGDVATLSFYPAHHITTGEGGAAFTRHSLIRRGIESARDWGRHCWCAPGMDNTCKQRFDWQLGDLPHGYDHKYIYYTTGYNLKMTDMQAAIGLAQLDKVDAFITARLHNFSRLKDGINDLSNFLIMPQATENSEPSWFGFPITVADDAPFDRKTLIAFLTEKKIATRMIFGGNLVRQPYLSHHKFRVSGELHESDRVMNQSFWVGVFPAITDPAIDYMVDCFHEFCRRY